MEEKGKGLFRKKLAAEYIPFDGSGGDTSNGNEASFVSWF